MIIKLMNQKRGQYVFVLEGIDFIEIIDENYGVKKEAENINESVIDFDDQTIEYDHKTTDLKLEQKTCTFYDINKNKIHMWLTMSDFVDQKHLPLTTDKPCWWCRHSFNSCPMGIPIRYYPDVQKGQHTEPIQTFLKKRNLPTTTSDYFETEGIFCSFPCCKAYILDNRFNSRYKKSLTLLSLLYYKLYDKYIDIPRAPSWKLLEEWGGSMNIEKFKNSFGKFVYQVTPNIKRPFLFTTGTYIEEIRVN